MKNFAIDPVRDFGVSTGTDSLGLFVISGAALVRSPHSATLAAHFGFREY